MPDAQVAFVRRLHRIYGGFALGVLAFVVLLGALERLGWPRGWIGAMFLIATILVYAVIGLISRTTDEVEYFVAGRRVPAMYNGMATAADWMSAASFIGTAGVLYLQGFAGLAYILGWTGGYCLVALLLAPYLRRFGQYTIPDFLGARYGALARVIGALSTVLVSFVYLVVQIYGVGLITSHLTGFTFEIGIFVGLGGVLVCSFLGGMRAVTWTQVAQYIVLIVAYTVPVVWLSVKQTGNPVPMLAYGAQVAQVSEREREIEADPREREVIEVFAQRARAANAKLADVHASLEADRQALMQRIAELKAADAPLGRIQQQERRLRELPTDDDSARATYIAQRDEALRRAQPLGGLPPHAQPYARPQSVAAEEESQAGSMQSGATHEGNARAMSDSARRNFIALALCLMVGTAAMPHILMRSYTTPSVSEARRSVAWALFFIALLYLMAPALAVFVKYEVLYHLVGVPFDELPEWIRRWSKLSRALVSARDVNGDGVLQFGELVMSGDLIVLAAPEIGGLPNVVGYLVAAGGLAAALSTADGLLLTIANALSHDIYYRVLNPQASPIRRVMLAKVMVLMVALGAAYMASLHLADILPFVAAAFSLASAALFPALTLGVFWRRANALGAAAGMLTGLGVCLYYMATNLPWTRALLGLPGAGARWFDIDPVAAGVFAVPAGLAVAIVGSLIGPSPGAMQSALVERIRGLSGPASPS